MPSTLLTGTFEKLKAEQDKRGFTYLGRYIKPGSQETPEQAQKRLPIGELETAAPATQLGAGLPKQLGDAAAARLARGGIQEVLEGTIESKGGTIANQVMEKLRNRIPQAFEQEGWGTQLLKKKESMFNLDTLFNLLDEMKAGKASVSSRHFMGAYTQATRKTAGKDEEY